MRKILKNGGLILLGLAFGALILGLGEVLLRVGFDVYRCDERLGWTFAPNKHALKVARSGEFVRLVRFNSLGLFDEDRSHAKPEGTFRILVLGDSFTAALQVSREKRFSTIVGMSLAGTLAPGKEVEVINAGTDGYGTVQQVLLFRERARLYEPDVVLLDLNLGSDVSDNWPESGTWNHYIAAECGRPYLALRGGVLEPLDGGTPKRIESSSAAEVLLRRFRLYTNFFWSPRPPSSPLFFTQHQIFDPVPPEGVRQSWQLTKRILLEFHRELEAQGIRLVVLILPEWFEVGQPRGSSGSVRHARDLERPQALLEDFLRAEAIPYIDLAPPMKEYIARGKGDLYFTGDPHWNESGHALVAGVLHEWFVGHCDLVALPVAGCGPR